MRRTTIDLYISPKFVRLSVRPVGCFAAKNIWAWARRLAPERIFVGFPKDSGSLPIWGGVKLRSGEIVMHGRGERMHYRTSAASRWGYISLAPEHLAAYTRAVAGFDLAAPPVGRILRPTGRAKAELLRLHAQAYLWLRPSPK